MRRLSPGQKLLSHIHHVAVENEGFSSLSYVPLFGPTTNLITVMRIKDSEDDNEMPAMTTATKKNDYNNDHKIILLLMIMITTDKIHRIHIT